MKLYFTILFFFTAFAASAGTKIRVIVTDQKGGMLQMEAVITRFFGSETEKACGRAKQSMAIFAAQDEEALKSSNEADMRKRPGGKHVRMLRVSMECSVINRQTDPES